MNETYFCMIRELDKEDDPHNEALWPKANPILQEENEYSEELLKQIRVEHDEAYHSNDPTKIREWLTKRVNRWQSDSDQKYMTSEHMNKWKSLAVSQADFLSWCAVWRFGAVWTYRRRPI